LEPKIDKIRKNSSDGKIAIVCHFYYHQNFGVCVTKNAYVMRLSLSNKLFFIVSYCICIKVFSSWHKFLLLLRSLNKHLQIIRYPIIRFIIYQHIYVGPWLRLCWWHLFYQTLNFCISVSLLRSYVPMCHTTELYN